MENNNDVNDKWFEVIKNDKDYDGNEFKGMLEQNDSNMVRTLMQYRNKLMQQNDEDNFINNIENLQRIFKEYIDENTYEFINKCLVKNNWTIKKAYEKARRTDCRLINIVSCTCRE